MSQHLESLAIGDKVKVKGPAGHVLYHGKGVFTISGQSFKVNRVSMIAGGTGITPIYQLAQAVARDPDDKTQLALLFSNHTPGNWTES